MNAQLDTRQRSPMQEKIIAYNEAISAEITAREQGKLTLDLTENRKRAYAELLEAQNGYLSTLKAA